MADVERFRDVEARIHAAHGLVPVERWIDLPTLGTNVRVQEVGDGPPALYANGIATPATGFAPLTAQLPGFRHVLIDLPGHALSPPYDWGRGTVRSQAVAVFDGVLDALGHTDALFIGNSLGGMFTLWFASDRPNRVRAAAIVGEPAIALPGGHGDAMLGTLATPVIGWLFEQVFRLPIPRNRLRDGFAANLGHTAARNMSDEMVDLHALALRLPGRAHSFRSLVRRLLDGRRPRPGHQLTDSELRALAPSTLFIWGDDDIFCAPDVGRVSVEKIPSAQLQIVQAGHCPWFDDAEKCGDLIRPFMQTHAQ